MRKTIVLLFLLCAILLTACGHAGRVDTAVLEIGPSEIYTEREIEAAMDVVLRQFKNFEGCTLTRLYYEEERSVKVSGEWAAQYDADEAIVLYSSFTVDPRGINPTLNPGQTYENWSWVLTRSNGGRWTLQTSGY